MLITSHSSIVMDFEFVAGEFAQQISQPVNFTEGGITFIAEIVG